MTVWFFSSNKRYLGIVHYSWDELGFAQWIWWKYWSVRRIESISETVIQIVSYEVQDEGRKKRVPHLLAVGIWTSCWRYYIWEVSSMVLNCNRCSPTVRLSSFPSRRSRKGHQKSLSFQLLNGHNNYNCSPSISETHWKL